MNMKYNKCVRKIFLTSILSLVTLLAFGQEETAELEKESQKEKVVKDGWNFGPLPAVSYNSDLGFQYGAMCDIYYYGDGSQYPEYLHKFNIEASAYTKGSSVFHFFYDSKYLFKNIRTTFTASYLPDKMMDFYGFNGYMTPYQDDLNASFYKINRDFFRTYLDFQGDIYGNIKWAAGLGFYNYAISPVSIDKYVDEESLYKLYLSEGILTEESSSGSHLQLKLGLVHDTRDNEADPTKGFWSEIITTSSLDLFQNQNNDFVRLSVFHRGYIPVVNRALTFAYRVGYQGVIARDAPYYINQDIVTLFFKQTYSEGLGGKNTIRGVLRNRVVGEGIAWANLELRWRFLPFNFIGQEWYCGINPFFDLGQVVQEYNPDKIMASDNELIYNGGAESLHTSVGIGAKLVMNQNFVLSAEFGKALNTQDGTNTLDVGVNYVF